MFLKPISEKTISVISSKFTIGYQHQTSLSFFNHAVQESRSENVQKLSKLVKNLKIRFLHFSGHSEETFFPKRTISF